MFYSDDQLIEYFKKIAKTKGEGKSAYVIYDNEWINVMDKDELEEYAMEQFGYIEDLDDDEISEILTSDISDISTIKRIIKLIPLSIIEI